MQGYGAKPDWNASADWLSFSSTSDRGAFGSSGRSGRSLLRCFTLDGWKSSPCVRLRLVFIFQYFRSSWNSDNLSDQADYLDWFMMVWCVRLLQSFLALHLTLYEVHIRNTCATFFCRLATAQWRYLSIQALQVKVKVGDVVSAGSVLAVLSAMKMLNETCLCLQHSVPPGKLRVCWGHSLSW